ncbi:MAG: aminomethyl-transferring glycine dehydrogenase subunit GcvPA [Chloroflexota bacterium]
MSYLPHTPAEREEMLRAIGVDSVEDLFANIPSHLRRNLEIADGLSEMEVGRLLNGLAAENLDLRNRASFLGAGAYHHYIPSAVGAIIGRSEFYTSYTPYQAEISQGTLQAIYEYQTMIAELTALDVSNASLYDAATAVVEAATIAVNQTRRNRIVVAGGLHPEYAAVLQTYLRAQGLTLTQLHSGWTQDVHALAAQLDDSVATVVMQSPNFWGALEPMPGLAAAAHDAGALFIAVSNPLSLALLAPPGEYGADIAVGCGQPFGIPLMYGGPYLGVIAVRNGLERRLPGRIAGATADAEGRKGYVLTLQAREQHIRREKATSNICTNHALMALAATVYLALLGKEGLPATANQGVQKAHFAAGEITALPGYSLAYDAPYFNEFALRCPVPAAEVNRFLLDRDIIGGFDVGQVDTQHDHILLLAFTEMTTRRQIDDLVATLAELRPQEAGTVDTEAERLHVPVGGAR